MSQDGFSKDRAELFEALGHPTRIRIVQILADAPLGFADLKKALGIERSGLLQFHLGKLQNLVKDTPEGSYALTDEGREAARISTTGEAGGNAQAKEKAHGIRPVDIVCVAAIVLLAVSAYFNFAMYVDNQRLNSNFNNLLQDYHSLNQSYNELIQRYGVEVSNVMLSNGAQQLSLNLANRGSVPITSVILDLNGTFIPFSTGINEMNRLYPNETFFVDLPVSWLDLDSNTSAGLVGQDTSLQNGSCFWNGSCNSYPLILKIVFSDGMHITKRVNATVKPYSGIELMVLHDGGVDIHSTGLFKMEDGRGVLSLEMKNVWGNFSNPRGGIPFVPISGFTILLDGEVVAAFQHNLGLGDRLIMSKSVSLGIEAGEVLELQVQSWSSDGESALNSMSVLCESA